MCEFATPASVEFILSVLSPLVMFHSAVKVPVISCGFHNSFYLLLAIVFNCQSFHTFLINSSKAIQRNSHCTFLIKVYTQATKSVCTYRILEFIVGLEGVGDVAFLPLVLWD